jgi:hypothetical protein
MFWVLPIEEFNPGGGGDAKRAVVVLKAFESAQGSRLLVFQVDEETCVQDGRVLTSRMIEPVNAANLRQVSLDFSGRPCVIRQVRQGPSTHDAKHHVAEAFITFLDGLQPAIGFVGKLDELGHRFLIAYMPYMILA